MQERAGQALDARQRLGLDRAELREVLRRDLGDARCRRLAPLRRRRGRRPRRKACTSSLVMRPFSPVPFTLPRSTSSSRAARRTLGLAWTSRNRPPICRQAARQAARLGGRRRGLPAARRGGSCCASSEGGWLSAPSSLPFSRRMGVPSLTRSPILTSTASTVPPRGAGTSIVALSDSSVEQRILGVDGVPRLDMDLDDRNVLEVADIGHFDFRGRHVSLPSAPVELPRCRLICRDATLQTLVGFGFSGSISYFGSPRRPRRV